MKRKHIRKRIGSLLMAVVMLLAAMDPFVGSGVFAVTSGLSLLASVDKSEVGPNEEISYKMDYSTVSLTSYFYDVKINFELPQGAVFTGVVESGHIQNPTKFLDKDGNDASGNLAQVRKVEFSLSNPEAGKPANQFKPGSSGSVYVKFKFPSPSVYANGKTILLAPSEISGKLGDANSEDALKPIDSAKSAALNLQYRLAKSWSIFKTGPSEKIISNSPAQKEISATYNVQLTGGNIPLKEVVITDTLPANASYVSDTLSGQAGVTVSTAEAGKVIWNVENVPVSGISFDVVIKYKIKRDAAEGVIAGDSRVNRVHVEGYASELQSDGSYAKQTDANADPFVTKDSSATTAFKASTAKWRVETTGPATVYLTKNPMVKTIDVAYAIKVSGGDIDIVNGELVYSIPPDVVSVLNTSGGAVDLSAHTITWSNFSAAANGTVVQNVTLRYNIDRDGTVDTGVWHNSLRANTVTATAKEAADAAVDVQFVPSTDQVETKFVVPEDSWYIDKSGTTSAVVRHRAADGSQGGLYYDLEYTINLAGSQYTVPLRTIEIVDTLPSYATYVSNTSGQEPTISGNQLTWNFSDLSTPGKSFKVVIRYAIDRDSTDPQTGYAPLSGLNQMTNTVSVRADQIDEFGNSAGSYDFKGRVTDSVKTTFVQAAVPSPSVAINIEKAAPYAGVYAKDGTKLIVDKHFNKGEDIVYEMGYKNTVSNGEALSDSVLEINNLTDQIHYKQLALGKAAAAVDYKLYYTIDGTNWLLYSGVMGGVFNTASNQTIDLETLTPGQEIKGFKYEFLANLPAGFDLSEKIRLKGTVKTSAVNTRYDANIKLDYKHRVFEGISPSKSVSDLVGFKVLWDEAWITNMAKTLVTPYSPGSLGHSANKTVTYQLKLTNHAGLGTKPLKDPVLVDVIPAGFEYKGNITFTSSYGASGLAAPENGNTIVKTNYPSRGETTVYFKWPSGAELKPGETLTLRYDALVESYAGVGIHYNQFYLYGSEVFKFDPTMTLITDAKLNETKNNELLKAQPLGTTIIETAAFDSTLWVKGELDSDYSRFPTVGRTVRGGTSDYKLEVQNVSNIYAKELEVIDILPFVGDTNVTDSNARNSQWRPYMIEAIASGYVEALVTDIYGDQSKANLTVYYSTAQNPIRENQLGQLIGSETPNWSVVPPSDMSTVQSLKFVINDFEENGKAQKLMKPGSKIQIAWKMRAPIDTDAGLVAWNSISQTATIVDYNNQTRRLLGAVPLQVGIDVKPSIKGEIGDFIWVDQNKNGLQDSGEKGVNGVKASLYKKNGTGFDWVKSTLSGDNQQGKPGYYLFPNLDEGEYYIAFDIKGLGYEVTKAAEGTNGAIDSDARLVGTELKTSVITLAEGEKNPNVDLGLFEASFVLTKQADKVNYSAVGTEIGYTVKVLNNGPVELTQVIVKDPLIGLNEVIPSLKVGESKSFTGTYKTVFKDLTDRKVVNTATADSDQTLEIKADVTVAYSAPSSSGGEAPIPPPDTQPTPPSPPVTPPVIPVTPGPLPPQPPVEPPTPSQPSQPKPTSNKPVTIPQDTVKVVDDQIPKGNVIISDPENGKVIKDDKGKWVYVPDKGFVGKDTFTITVKHPDGTETVQTIEVEVEATPLGNGALDQVKQPMLPKTGESSKWPYYGIGALLFGLGLMLRRSKA